jgi:glycosyltransferase involved in cell wall biosynthesis
VKLRVIGYPTVGHHDYLEILKAEANQLRLADRIEVLGTVPTRKELFEWCRRSDVGLALMPSQSDDPNEQTMTGASNKPFDYLACGLAVLVSDRPDWCEMFVKPGYGLCCNPSDPSSIATAVRYLCENSDTRRSMAVKGQQRILSEWNYESEFKKVLPAWGA